MDDALCEMPAALRAAVETLVVNLAKRPVPDFDIYIGRDFAGRQDVGFGNPIKLRADSPGQRVKVLVSYWGWLNGPSKQATDVRKRIRAGELTGKTLACWCAGKGLCHGHILAGLANGFVEETKGWIEALGSQQG